MFARALGWNHLKGMGIGIGGVGVQARRLVELNGCE